MGKKTFRVAKLLIKVNRLCENEDVHWQEKKMVCALLEDILQDTGNYEGFGYHKGFGTIEDEYNRYYYVSADLHDEYLSNAGLIDNMNIYHQTS